MLDRFAMTRVLHKYEKFLAEVAVLVLRQPDSEELKVERKLVDFIRGKHFAINPDTLYEYLEKMSGDHVGDKVVKSMNDMQSALMNLIVFMGSEGNRQTIYTPLMKIMKDEYSLYRPFALIALSANGSNEALVSLIELFASLDDETRWATLALLQQSLNERFIPLFTEALTDPEPEVAKLAIKAIGKAGAIEQLDQIKPLLYSPSESVALVAVSVMAVLGDPAVSGDLTTLYQKTDSNKIKATVVSAFGHISSPGSLQFLEQALDDNDSRVRANAIMAIKKLSNSHKPSDSVINKIRKLATDPDHRVRADSIQALWRLGDTERLDDVKAMLMSEKEANRSSGAYLCGKLKLSALISNLESLTADDSWSVRKMAALALLAIGEQGKSALDNLLIRGTPDQQIIAAFATGISQDSKAIDEILAESRSGSEMSAKATSVMMRLSTPR